MLTGQIQHALRWKSATLQQMVRQCLHVCVSRAGVTNSWSCELQCGGSESLVGCSASCVEAEVTLTFVHCKRSIGK